MQTITEHLTADHERMPLGTGAELARLQDANRELAEALAALMDNVMTFSDDESLKWHRLALEYAAKVLDRHAR